MKLYTCGAFRVLTSLCISDICLANCVSAVSGSSEYKFLLISFLPSSLYFTCTHTHTLTLNSWHTAGTLSHSDCVSVFLTSLQMSLSSLASCVSVVAGSWWYRELLTSFLPSCLYFTYKDTKQQAEFKLQRNICLCFLSCLWCEYLTLQLCHLFGVLSLQSLGQLRVQRAGRFLLPCFFIFALKNKERKIINKGIECKRCDWGLTFKQILNTRCSRTSLCISDTALANCISLVCGSCEYTLTLWLFFPLSLYLF